jgi:hypothetical protein
MLSKLNGKRNYSLRRAEELIKAHASASGKETKINWKTSDPGIRNIEVDGSIAFMQNKADIGGKFLPPFESLALA